MTGILAWATRWNLPHQAVAELMQVMGTAVTVQPPDAPLATSEAATQAQVRIEASKRGIRLFRNNVGVAMSENGTPVRYGLANDSKQLNTVCKSSDLIGITPITCGCNVTWGVFTSYECKRPNWKFSQNDQRAVAQLAWLKLVISMGGIGKFITSVDQL